MEDPKSMLLNAFQAEQTSDSFEMRDSRKRCWFAVRSDGVIVFCMSNKIYGREEGKIVLFCEKILEFSKVSHGDTLLWSHESSTSKALSSQMTE